jgi:hypothetical protein
LKFLILQCVALPEFAVPSVDSELIRISVAVNNLKNKGIDVTRYNLASEPDAFANNSVISQLLMDKNNQMCYL